MRPFRSIPILLALALSLPALGVSSGFNINGAAQFLGMIPGFRTTAVSTTALATDFFICVTDTGSARTVTLSPASAFAARPGRTKGGAVLAVVDCSQGAATHNITITPSGSDTINGSGSSLTISTNGGDVKLFTDGISKFWTWGAAVGTFAPLASPHLTGSPLINGGLATNVPFVRTCTITAAAAGTAVHCLADADVGAAQSVYISGWHMQINGATGWGTTATCAIQDTNGSAVNFSTVAVAAMTNAAYITPSTSNVTLGSAFKLGTGGTAGKGIDLKCNANGTGSDAVVTIAGVMK